MPDIHRFFVSFWWLAWAAALTALVVSSIQLSEGHLIYSLDDPYIHLAVARRILQGGYGANLQEFSSPSSSILYPFLLVPLLALGMGTWSALLINVVAAGFSVWLLLKFFEPYCGPTLQQKIFAWIIAPFLILSINMLALPLTGMEHSLQVLCAIIIMRGLADLFKTNRVTPSLCVATALMPLIRFEGTALSLATLIVLAFTKHGRAAAKISLFLCAAFGAWALFMHHLGLPFLPDSVLVKSQLANTTETPAGFADVIESLYRNFSNSFRNIYGILFAVAIVVLTLTLPFTKEDPLHKGLMGFVVIFALAAHMVGGQFGSGDRYEVYAVAILMMAIIYYLGPVYARLQHPIHIIPLCAFAASAMLLSYPYAKDTQYVPRSSRNIYEQHYQMHRFAAEFFPRRVAVDDLGLVAYGNDAFVLDLIGLGSDMVRKTVTTQTLTPEILSHLVESVDIDYAMIYDVWAKGNVPTTWCKLAVMRTERVSAGDQDVSFYAIKPAAIPAMNAALDRFAPTLPARDLLVRSACQPVSEQDFRKAYINRAMNGAGR